MGYPSANSENHETTKNKLKSIENFFVG